MPSARAVARTGCVTSSRTNRKLDMGCAGTARTLSVKLCMTTASEVLLKNRCNKKHRTYAAYVIEEFGSSRRLSAKVKREPRSL